MRPAPGLLFVFDFKQWDITIAQTFLRSWQRHINFNLKSSNFLKEASAKYCDVGSFIRRKLLSDNESELEGKYIIKEAITQPEY